MCPHVRRAGMSGPGRKPPRTREDWERGWTFIEPFFADLPPADISLELLDEWYGRLLRVKGVDIAYRAMKTWRSLYTVMAGMKLCTPKADPSHAIRRQTPNRRCRQPRSARRRRR